MRIVVPAGTVLEFDAAGAASVQAQLGGAVVPTPTPGTPAETPATPAPPVYVPSGGKLVRMQLPWTPGAVAKTSDYGHCGPYDVVSVKFTTGNTPTDPTNLPWLQTAEYVDPLYERQACISEIEGSFDAVQGAMLSTVFGTSVKIPFSVETPLDPKWTGLYPILNRNSTYYFNFKIRRPEEVPGTADVRVDIATGEH